MSAFVYLFDDVSLCLPGRGGRQPAHVMAMSLLPVMFTGVIYDASSSPLSAVSLIHEHHGC